MDKKQLKINYLICSLMAAFLISFANSSHAQDLYPTLTVVNIKAAPDLQKNHNKMYLHILEYNSDSSTRAFTVPKLPLIWPSTHISSMDNLEIWSGILSENQSTSLIVSIIEHQVLPWNTDNLIGMMTINLKNEKGKLVEQWNIPNRTDLPKIVQEFGLATHQLTLSKDKNSLSLYFSLVEENQTPSINQYSKNSPVNKK